MRDGVLGAEIPPAEKLSEIERIVVLCTHTQQNRTMTSDERLLAGDLVAIGRHRTVVSQEFADSMEPGDQVEVIIQGIGTLRHTVVRAT